MKLPEKYLLYVGNAYPHKNLERLLKAVLSIKYQVSSIKLVLVGEEDFFYKRLGDHVKKLGLEDVVVFWGKADRGELTSLYKNAMALIFPSLMEGFGLPAVEALSHGCLVLVSDIPVFHEVLAEAAVYFNPDDVNGMAEKMADVLSNPEKYENLKKLGLELVKKYSWEKLARETLEIYKSVVK